jgi:RNA polymerase sigma factor (sigma-70 family)
MSTSAFSHTLSFSSAADRDLVASAAQGFEGGFEELVKRYQRPISGYVYRMVGDYDAALDLTQEIFIKIYGSLLRYRPEFKFSTWIYKIAHNAAIDHLRRNTVVSDLLSTGLKATTTIFPLRAKALARNSRANEKNAGYRLKRWCARFRLLIVSWLFCATRRTLPTRRLSRLRACRWVL